MRKKKKKEEPNQKKKRKKRATKGSDWSDTDIHTINCTHPIH